MKLQRRTDEQVYNLYELELNDDIAFIIERNINKRLAPEDFVQITVEMLEEVAKYRMVNYVGNYVFDWDCDITLRKMDIMMRLSSVIEDELDTLVWDNFVETTAGETLEHEDSLISESED